MFIRKKHVIGFAVVLALALIASSIADVNTYAPWHFLQQVAKGPYGAPDANRSIDENRDGVVDAANNMSCVGGVCHVNGVLDMNNNRITNVPMPLNSFDIANKQYVDAQSGGTTVVDTTSSGTMQFVSPGTYFANGGDPFFCMNTTVQDDGLSRNYFIHPYYPCMEGKICMDGYCKTNPNGFTQALYRGNYRNYNVAPRIFEADEGGFYLFSSYLQGMELKRVDISGMNMWTRNYASDYSGKPVRTDDGGFILVTGQYNYIRLTKMDTSGDVQWSQVSGVNMGDIGTGSSVIPEIAIQTADGFAVPALTYSGQLVSDWNLDTRYNWYRSAIHRFNSDGTYRDVKTYDKPGTSFSDLVIWGKWIERTDDGGFVMVGHWQTMGPDRVTWVYERIGLIKFDANWDVIAVTPIDYTDTHVLSPMGIIHQDDGNFLLICAYKDNNGYWYIYSDEYDEGLNIISNKGIGPLNRFSTILKFIKTHKILPPTYSVYGQIAVIGTTETNELGLDWYIYGNPTHFNPGQNSWGHDMIETSDGKLAIIGISETFTGEYDLYFLKTDLNGKIW